MTWSAASFAWARNDAKSTRLTTALATEFLGDPDMAVLVVRPGAVVVVASDQALLLGEGARPARMKPPIRIAASDPPPSAYGAPPM